MTAELNRDNLTVAMITRNEEAAVGNGHCEYPPGGAGRGNPDRRFQQRPHCRNCGALGARVIKQFPPRGYGPAMDTALRSGNGRVVVTLDCDDTYPAERIAELARLVLDEGYDLVDASRLKGKPKAMPWLNYFANVGFAMLASALFFRWVTDLHSGMRAYRKSMIDELRYEANGAALPVELLLRPLKMGKRFRVVFIDYRERVGQTTMRPLQSAWWTLKRILKVRFS